MIAYQVNTKSWTVDEVECPNGMSYPNCDAERFPIYDNTHFARQADAINRLRSEAEAGVRLAAERVIQARRELSNTERIAANAAIALNKAIELWNERVL